MKHSTVVLLTAILLAGTLVFPWTDVVKFERVEGEPRQLLGRTYSNSRLRQMSSETTPYFFAHEPSRTRKTMRWDYTFIQFAAIALIGGAFYVNAKANPKEKIHYFGKTLPPLPKAPAPRPRHALMPTPGALALLLFIVLLFAVAWFG